MEPVRKEMEQEVVGVGEDVEREPAKTMSGVVPYRPVVLVVVAAAGAVTDWEEGKTVAV